MSQSRLARREAAVMPEGLYIYGVIGTGEARNFGPIGVGGRGDSVITIAYQDLSAVVSSVPMEKYVVGQETMLTHERVLEKVMADHTVLPLRYYTVAPNAEEVRGLLRSQHVEFKKWLRELDNKVELGLKALWKDMTQVLREIVDELPQEKGPTAAASPSSGNNGARADKRVRLALDEKKAQVRECLLHPLRPLAIDLCLNKIYGDDMIMNAAFLLDRSREREFDARVQQLSSDYGDTVEFKYVGPVPPYSFVNIVVKEELSPVGAPGARG